jgi:nickel transport protein
MRWLTKVLCAGVFWVLLTGQTPVPAQSTPGASPRDVVLLLEQQNEKLSGELRRIQREIAALRAELSEPGLDEILSGIGYILGLFGTAAFVASRRRK